MTDLAQAINSIDESLEFHIIGTELSGITWIGNPKNIPSDEEILTKVTELQTEWDAQDYARKRKIEYDALNQLEMQYDDEVNGTTTWKDAIVAIKTKYPKG
jgi:hypothetical protein